MDLTAWCSEVIELGDIVQDSGDTVPTAEAERRFNRYVELVTQVTGREPDDVFRCLLRSVRDQDDYGAHEAVLSALLAFKPNRLGRLAATELPGLIRRAPDFAGNFLGQVAFRSDDVVAAFNAAAASLGTESRAELRAFVAEQERGEGWLTSDSHKGRLRVA